MHLGYFGLMGYRERGKSPHAVFQEHIEQVIHADQLGFEIAWFAEHHFSNYCICPSPLLMAARCAGVTRRILLAPGVVVAPLYDPARLLAEIGMVDCLADGRLVLGLGSGYQPYEFERFGDSVYRYGHQAGMCFAARQGGPFASPRIGALVSTIRGLGVRGVGQSSWGPTVFALLPNEAEAEYFSDHIGEHLGNPHTIEIVQPNNTGALIARHDHP